MTGFIGELFGTVEPVKVANAEERMLGRFRHLNEIRQRLSVRDSMFSALVNSVFTNSTKLGAALILIIVGQSMRASAFTVGDFALFVFYLGLIGWWSNTHGSAVAQYRQLGVSIERMNKLLEGAPAGKLVEHGPVYLRGASPEVTPVRKTEADRLARLTATGLTVPLPGLGARHRGHRH